MRTKDEREKRERESALVRVRGWLATGGGSGPSLHSLLALSFFLSFFKVLLLLLLLEKVSSLSFQRERKRSMCVCLEWMEMRFSRLSRPDKKEEEEFFLWVFFFEEEEEEDKRNTNNKKK
jgi:hypothetical protein